jgi:tRNA uridine 5-carboxymethylaminomethyl modification enzyme
MDVLWIIRKWTKKRRCETDKFSYSDLTAPLTHQRSCHMTYTSWSAWYFKRRFDRSPMFNGRIRSLGPRYCPYWR